MPFDAKDPNSFRMVGGVVLVAASLVTFLLAQGNDPLDANAAGGGQPVTTAPPTDTTAPPTDTTVPPTETTAPPADTTLAPPGTAVGGRIALFSASASRSAPTVTGPGGETLSYGPENAIDGRRDTAWCVKGDAIGDYLRVDFFDVVSLQSVAIVPGYDKVDPTTGDDRWDENRKITALNYLFSGATPRSVTFGEPLRQFKFTVFDPALDTIFVQIEPTFTGGDIEPERDYTCISEVAAFGVES